MKVLVTGFEPFGDDTVNASWTAAQCLSTVSGGEHQIVIERLPVSFVHTATVLRALLEQHRPDVLLMFGQAGNCDEIRLERVALNMQDAVKADNDGYVPDEVPVRADGPAAYFCPIPLKPLRFSLQKAGIPAKISNTAGTYVCNTSYYEALHWQQTRSSATKVLFVHVPLLQEQMTRHPRGHFIEVSQLHRAVQLIADYFINPSASSPFYESTDTPV